MFLIKLLKIPSNTLPSQFTEIPEIRHFWFFRIHKTKKWLYFRLVDKHKKLKEVEEEKAKAVNLKSKKVAKLTKPRHQATYEFSPCANNDSYPEDHPDVQTFLYWHYSRFGSFPK